MEVREGLFGKIREAMKGQDFSLWETPEGRVIAYMNAAGNLIVERCYGERQSISIDPNDEMEGWAGDYGFFDPMHGVDERDTIEAWWVGDEEEADLLRQLGSITPIAMQTPDEQRPHSLWFELDLCQASRGEIAMLYRELESKLDGADKRWLYSNEADGLRFGAAVDRDAHIMICHHAINKSVPQYTISVYPDGAIGACFYSGGNEFPVYDFRRDEFEKLCERLRLVKFSDEEPLTASTSAVHQILDATNKKVVRYDLPPGVYVLERIANPFGYTSYWLVLLGTKIGQAEGAWRRWAEHTDESRIIFSR